MFALKPLVSQCYAGACFNLFCCFADIYLPIMSSKSKLSTLLQYRFVKKPVEKISVESRDDEKTSTEESDNSQESQNGPGILTDNNVDIPTISLKYEDSCTSTPTVNGNDLAIARNIFMILSQGFQYFPSVPVLHYLQAVLLKQKLNNCHEYFVQYSLKSGGTKYNFIFNQVKVPGTILY